jgi:hypothetical protein
MEIHQHREQIDKLRGKIESTYYQVTQMAIDNRPRLQKLHNMSKLKIIMIMANEAMEELLNQTDLKFTKLNHLIYAAATFTTEEVNGTGEYKPQTQRLKSPTWVRRIQGSINDIRKDLSVLIEIKWDSRKVKNKKKPPDNLRNITEKEEIWIN